jgi:hypothetical protein
MREVTLIVGANHMSLSAADACIALEEGAPVILVREPNNPHDGNAIKCLDLFGREMGYVQREVAAIVARWMDEGFMVSSKCIRKSQYRARRKMGLLEYRHYTYPRAAIYREEPTAEKTYTVRAKGKNKHKQFEIVE